MTSAPAQQSTAPAPDTTLHPPERLLTGPGPSNPHPAVTAALGAPMVGHLDPFFVALMDQTMANLRTLFQTANHHTIPISGTGSCGLESLMLNLLEPGDEAIVGVIGYFGQRLAEMARRAGATVRIVEEPLGGIIDPARIQAELDRRPAKLVALVHAETSTGACQPLEEIGRIVRDHEALLAVDCVTSLAGMPVEIDAWGIDAAGSCSQKCIGAPPGLGPVTFGPRALDAVRTRSTPTRSWYVDLSLLFEYWGEGGGSRARAFHHTAPVASIYAFHRALELIVAEGLPQRFARHRAAHEYLVAGLDRLGLTLFTPAAHRLPMLNVVSIPEGVDDARVRSRLLDMNIEVAAGFGPLNGKAWRIGIMGYNADPARIDRLLDGLAQVLAAERT